MTFFRGVSTLFHPTSLLSCVLPLDSHVQRLVSGRGRPLGAAQGILTRLQGICSIKEFRLPRVQRTPVVESGYSEARFG